MLWVLASNGNNSCLSAALNRLQERRCPLFILPLATNLIKNFIGPSVMTLRLLLAKELFRSCETSRVDHVDPH